MTSADPKPKTLNLGVWKSRVCCGEGSRSSSCNISSGTWPKVLFPK